MKGTKANSTKATSKKGNDKLAVKKMTKKEKNAAKDPNKPKRAPSAFFVFMEKFRADFKAENPTIKSVAAVGKAGGAEWKSMSDEDKAPFVAEAGKRKDVYETKLAAYNKKKDGGDDGEESDKSKSEVNDEEDKGECSEEDEDDE